jgi:hypothetical protein
MKKPNTNPAVAEQNGARLRCLMCGEIVVLTLLVVPSKEHAEAVLVDVWCAAAKAFAKLHARCRVKR